MAKFRITMEIEAARLATVEKKATEVFGEKVHVEKIELGASSRAARFEQAISSVADAKGACEELRDELQEWHDNLPENLQSGSKADELDSAIQELDSLVSTLEDAEGTSVEFPGMY